MYGWYLITQNINAIDILHWSRLVAHPLFPCASLQNSCRELGKTHCCKRKILHIARPGDFLYLDIENSVMGNEIFTPLRAQSLKCPANLTEVQKYSGNLAVDPLITTVPNMWMVSQRCSSVRLSAPFVFYIIKSYLGGWLRYWEKNS
jgi:hypothetical protein